MSLRDRVRAIRLYAKSFRLFRETFANWRAAAWLPFVDSVAFHERGLQRTVTVPGGRWSMLPTVCRLLRAGATPSFDGNAIVIEGGGMTLRAPATDKSIGSTYHEIFVDDVYGIASTDLAGKVVIDAGAFVGDSSLAFAQRGAVVHAFEPLPMLWEYLRANADGNRLPGQVIPHEVGLSDQDGALEIWVNAEGSAGATSRAVGAKPGDRSRFVAQSITLVDALTYLSAHGIERADILKLDCEGCEYRLLANQTLLDRLQPERVILEYHQGPTELKAVLEAWGFQVTVAASSGPVVGFLDARRTV